MAPRPRGARPRCALLPLLLLLAACGRAPAALASPAATEKDCPTAVFILSTGRTGSTSVLEVLNSLPGVQIMGENLGFWHAVSRVDERASKAVISKFMTAFYHTPGVDRASLLAGYRDVLLGYLNPRPGVVLTGFKETHWQWKEGLRDARLLLEAFPCAKLVLNWRQDVAAQLDSQHAHPRVVKDLPKDMEARNKQLVQLEEEFPSRTFRLTTEMMGDDGNVNRLLAWLGFPGCRLKGHRVNANQNGTHVGNGTFAHVNCD